MSNYNFTLKVTNHLTGSTAIADLLASYKEEYPGNYFEVLATGYDSRNSRYTLVSFEAETEDFAEAIIRALSERAEVEAVGWFDERNLLIWEGNGFKAHYSWYQPTPSYSRFYEEGAEPAEIDQAMIIEEFFSNC
jgi:hypothetical protein